MFSNYLKENTTNIQKENNPLYYIFIIPKLVKSVVEKVKQDDNLNNLINFIEDNTRELNIKQLEKKHNPISFMTLFQTETVKKNTADYIEQYLTQFELDLAGEEKDFTKCYKVHQIFEMIKNSDVYKVYIKNL